ncbi:unnamed protein product [Lactuca virosa]|uniref:Uncharacterized protein n=1 Tax=Lactuca virosa TaxID=75947 RepID=A0AAU9LTL5_9ASTR|nr:unnamed protein product [Lactuca virosa]
MIIPFDQQHYNYHLRRTPETVACTILCISAMSKVWGNIGAWAAEAERAEAEEKELAAAAAAAPPQSYPSLKEAVNTNKGKKKTKMTLHEFTMAGSGGLGGGALSRELAYDRKGLTPEEMMRLPTGPKERSAEEMQYGRLGGGFSSYGGGRGGPRMRDREGDGDAAWGNNRRSYGEFSDDRRVSSPRISEYDQPSRADEVDNWAMTKKPITPSYDALTRPSRYGHDPTRSSNFGPGFRDSGGSEDDRWKRGVVPRDGDQERPTERRRLVLDPPKGESAPVEPSAHTNKPSPFGAARPREEVLAEKGLDHKKVDLEIDAKKSSSRPTSSHSGSSVDGRTALQPQGLEKTRPKVNPFGDAKPREVLLQEKGIDYRKIDVELERRRLGRSDTDEAIKKLKEKIDNLKREYNSGSDANNESNGNGNQSSSSLSDRILEKEKKLEQLNHDLDNKIRFSQKPVERTVLGSIDDSRSVDSSETRGSNRDHSWVRKGDDRGGFGRSNSKERW